MPTTKRRGEEDPLASATTAPIGEEMIRIEPTSLMGGGEEDDPVTLGEGGEEDGDTAGIEGTNPFGGF